MQYLITPFLAWLVAGILKFLINSFRAKKWAFSLIGYGGMPSNHSAIVSSTTCLIALKEGMASPAFGLGLTLAFVVLLDAKSLRGEVGKHAQRLNALNQTQSPLRERIGHKIDEILAGIALGCLVACWVFWFF